MNNTLSIKSKGAPVGMNKEAVSGSRNIRTSVTLPSRSSVMEGSTKKSNVIKTSVK